MTKFTASYVKNYLLSYADEKGQKFGCRIIPGCSNILGVRTPIMRSLAKEIAQDDYLAYLQDAQDEYYEETMVQGMVISYLKTDIEEVLHHTAAFIPKINNWAVNDSFTMGFNFKKKDLPAVWNFVQSYLVSRKEYEARFAIVVLLAHFVNEEYIDRILAALDSVTQKDYYANMAVAWALCECYLKFPVKTLAYMQNSNFTSEVFNKAIQKICESKRVSFEDKTALRCLKR
ncbi:MAG: DNA alkylation repair protein [Chloroflexi bacterium]|nr:DNA alkylation repair protein [Chloroflexota bacterium]